MAATRAVSPAASGLPAAAARVPKSSTASPGPPSPASMDSPGTGNTHSNGTSSRARLVTSTDSCGLPASSRSSSPGSPSSRCSQLSRTSSVFRGASQPSTVSSLDRPWRSPRPSAAAIAGPAMAGSVTGTRSTYHAPSAYRPATSVTTLSASRVLPTPPGPTAVTSRCAASAAASSARSATRPTNEVSGEGSGTATVGGADPAGRRAAAAAASARRSFTWSLRSSEDTWLSTVRTEMNSRAAISALVRCSPTAASTSASRADTPTPETTEPAPIPRFCPETPPPRRLP